MTRRSSVFRVVSLVFFVFCASVSVAQATPFLESKAGYIESGIKIATFQKEYGKQMKENAEKRNYWLVEEYLVLLRRHRVAIERFQNFADEPMQIILRDNFLSTLSEMFLLCEKYKKVSCFPE